jgi:hypothetical protein
MERRISSVRFINAAAVHAVVKHLAGLCDGATSLDGQGFNKLDSFNGHSWAMASRLTDETAERARDMVRKYRRQIPDDLWRAMWQ